MEPKPRVPPFPGQTIEAVASVLGATQEGLTNAERRCPGPGRR
jgi:hypothetical protein